MLKMYQAMANLEIAVESVLPGRVKDDFNFALTRDLVFAWFATRAYGIPTAYDAHHPPVNRGAERIIGSFSRSKNLLGMSFNSQGLYYNIYSPSG